MKQLAAIYSLINVHQDSVDKFRTRLPTWILHASVSVNYHV